MLRASWSSEETEGGVGWLEGLLEVSAIVARCWRVESEEAK